MIEAFSSFSSQWGHPVLIPHKDLFEYINHAEIRDSLANEINLGLTKYLETLNESPMGREVRRRCKQDLFWMAKYFTWETNPASSGRSVADNRITESEYKIICDMFVKKDDTKTVVEQDIVCKNRLLLWPRGGFKSTIDVCDTAQWILNFPNIRILFLTGADDLAKGFVEELKGHFLIKPEQYSLMNLFFPEYCIDDLTQKNQFRFTCPLWAAKKIKRKEPTVQAASVGKTKSGWHYEVIKADDSVCDKNTDSNTNPEQCKKISVKIFTAEKLLVPGGYYMDYIGTRYNDNDHYGVILEQNIGDIVTETPHPCVTYTRNNTTGMRILIGRAIQIKPEVATQLEKEGRSVTYKEAGKKGCDLLIPTVMPYEWLMQEYAKNETVFEGQLNQNPRPPSKVVFDRMLLVRHTIPYSDLPMQGPISITWDFAFSKKKGRDYSTACAVMWGANGRFYIIDIVRGRYKHTELAKAVVDFARRWRPFVIGIEDAAGSKFLEPTIIREAENLNIPAVTSVCSRIDWYTPDNQDDAKKMRMAALHPYLTSDQMWFGNIHGVNSNLETIYSEFEGCLTSHHHDDIPDVIAQQLRYIQKTYTMFGITNKSESQSVFSSKDAAWNILFEEGSDQFGRIGFGPPPQPFVVAEPEPEYRAESDISGLPPILGAGW